MFVFVDAATNKAVREKGCVMSYADETTAKRVRTRRIRAGKMDPKYQVTSIEVYRENDKLVEVVNLMSGKVVMIQESARGGCTDPSTETYWCM